MPSGKVKFFDVDKGFGFITSDDGKAVFLRASALPAGTDTIKSGTKVEFSVADGHKGPQAMQVTIVAEAPSVARSQRRKPAVMVPVIEDLIKLLDVSSQSLRRGRYPDNSHKIAQLLRILADDFDA